MSSVNPSDSRMYVTSNRSRIDESNVHFFRNVIKDYGFPNEHILGIARPSIDFPGAIVLHHHCESLGLDSTGSKYNFEPDFFTAIQQGELDPYRMAQLLQMQGPVSPDLGQNTVIQLALHGDKSKPFRQKLSPGRIDFIERNRARAGLDTQESYFKKSLFALYDLRAMEYNFSRYTRVEIYDCDEATYAKLLHALEPLDKY